MHTLSTASELSFSTTDGTTYMRAVDAPNRPTALTSLHAAHRAAHTATFIAAFVDAVVTAVLSS